MTFRPVAADEFESFMLTTERAFGADLHPDDLACERTVIEYDRTLAAFDGTDVVASAGIYSLSMTVPGGPIPVAGVTFVGVLPSHRRRGILTGLMERQLHGLHEESGESVAALWASEAAIYGRYGYGLASTSYDVTIHRGEGTVLGPGDDRPLRIADVGDVRDQLASVFDAAAPERPGFFARDERWWGYRLADPDHRRAPWARRLAVVATGPDGPEGYALYRTHLDFADGLPSGKARVDELVATTLPAQLALWRMLLSLDLMTTVTASVAIDDPMLLLLADPRRARPMRHDSLWVRVVDVDRALAARRYATDIDVVIEVADDRCKWNVGRWRLTGGPQTATCTPTTDAADIGCDVRALGAAYLGATSLHTLALAGLAEERTAGALAATAAAFGAARAAYCPMVF